MRLDRADPAEVASYLAARHLAVKRATGRRPSLRKRLPRQQQPDAIRVAYYRELRAAVRAAHQSVKDRLYAVGPDLFAMAARERGDGLHLDETVHERLLRLLRAAAEAQAARLASGSRSAAEAIARRLAEFQKQQLNRQVKAAFGVDVLRSEPWLQRSVEGFTAENVSLIKSVSQQYFSEIEKVVMRGASSGTRWETIAEELEGRFGVAESRAKLIARDQVGKFYGALNERRQQDLGLTHYIWRGMNDNRERPEHLAREGKRFSFDKPPADGPPGQAINCRCYSEPDFGPLLEELP